MKQPGGKRLIFTCGQFGPH